MKKLWLQAGLKKNRWAIRGYPWDDIIMIGVFMLLSTSNGWKWSWLIPFWTCHIKHPSPSREINVFYSVICFFIFAKKERNGRFLSWHEFCDINSWNHFSRIVLIYLMNFLSILSQKNISVLFFCSLILQQTFVKILLKETFGLVWSKLPY